MNTYHIDLQLFGDGGEGEGSGATSADAGQNTGVEVADAADRRLAELGVPEEKLKKHTEARAKRAAINSVNVAQTETAEPSVQETVDAPKLSWDEIMKDPEYNGKMQETVKAAVSRYKDADTKLSQLAPAIELLTEKYGLDATNLDTEALAKAISDDDSYYEDKALEMGVSVETAKAMDKSEREAKRAAEENQKTIQEQAFNSHIQKLQEQGEELKKTFKQFDLISELRNPTFARLTSPGVGLSVEDAYYAVHRKEIQAASSEIIAKQTARKMSNAIQSGMSRPAEAGTSSAAPSVSSFDYKNMSREQRQALRQRIHNAAARGEKLYPGQ